MSRIVNKAYSKYHSIKHVREKKRVKNRNEGFSHLFQPTAEISFKKFAQAIEDLGVSNSDNILIRLSSQCIPFIEGGLLVFYKNLFDYADSGNGNVLSLSYTFDRSPLMYLSKGNIFSAENTATTLGLCNELFRRMENTDRSIHPTHSVSAYGCDSAEITARHHENLHTYSTDSPFAYLYEKGCGKEVIVGLSHSSVGQHFIENKTPITGEIKKPVLCKLDVGGKIIERPFLVDNPFIKAYPFYHDQEFISFLFETGVLKQTFVNGVSIYVYDSRLFYEKMEAVYNSEDKPYKILKIKSFFLNRIVRPAVLKSFFDTKNNMLIPRES